jgi:hypothetical protein
MQQLYSNIHRMKKKRRRRRMHKYLSQKMRRRTKKKNPVTPLFALQNPLEQQ